MIVFVTYKNEEDPIRKWRHKSDHNIIQQFLRRTKAANSPIIDGIWLKFKRIQAFIEHLITCKHKDDPSKNEGTRVVTTFIPLWVYGKCSWRSRSANSAAGGLIWQNFEPMRDFVFVFVTCKNEEDPSKIKTLEWSQDHLLIFQTLKGS